MSDDTISFEEFRKVDIRVGSVVEAEPFPEARKPSIILMIDFGPEIGIKKSSAQIVEHYGCEMLIGRQVMAVVNLQPRQIGPIKSEVLTLGFLDAEAAVFLAGPDGPVPDGQRLI
jgi:tRNA-binding protein